MSNSRLVILKIFLTIAIVIPLVTTPASTQPVTKVDVFFLFDDTGSFTTFAGPVRDIFTGLVDGLETALPGVEFGYGVGRFEDYGGPGWDFCSNFSQSCTDDFERRVSGRPFILNQPIVTAATAGGDIPRNTLIIDALGRTAPSIGGDDPESHIEALWQIANGTGFDANGDGLLNGLDGTQTAGANVTQVSPDQSGDVPAFSSLLGSLPVSGSVGGVGFRPDALKLVLVATEICSAIAFPAGGPLADSIVGKYSTEPVTPFSCRSTSPGNDRFGFVSNSISAATNSVPNAVVPRGAATLNATVAALNAADIRVLAMGPGLTPMGADAPPAHDPSGFLSALARLTGGIDSSGTPLVFDIGAGGAAMRDNIVAAIQSASIVNPGCASKDLTATFVSYGATMAAQRRLAQKIAKKTGSNSTRRSTATQAKKLLSASNVVSQAFPKQITVCESTACQSVDKSAELQTLRRSATRMDQLIRSLLKRVKGKKGTKKLSAKAAKLRAENSTNLAAIPDHTNTCG